MLLKALWCCYTSLMRFFTLRPAFAVKSLNSVSHFSVSTLTCSVFLSSCLSVSVFLSFSLWGSDTDVEVSHLCESHLQSSDHHHIHHHPLVCPLLHLLSHSPFIHPFIHPSITVRQSRNYILFSTFNSTSMNQSLVAARDAFSCFTLGALW